MLRLLKSRKSSQSRRAITISLTICLMISFSCMLWSHYRQRHQSLLTTPNANADSRLYHLTGHLTNSALVRTEDLLARVMQYAEQGKELDPNVRVEFITRIVRNLQHYHNSSLSTFFAAVLNDHRLYHIPQIQTSKKAPPVWGSRSLEQGVLRVVRFLEREREIDGVVRDKFVDSVWQILKLDLIISIAYNSNICSSSNDQNTNQATKKLLDFVRSTWKTCLRSIPNKVKRIDFITHICKRWIRRDKHPNHDILTNSFNVDTKRLETDKIRDPKTSLQLQTDPKSSPTITIFTDDESNKENGLISSPTNLNVPLKSTNNLSPTSATSISMLSLPVINSFEMSYKTEQDTACFTSPTDILIAVPSAPGNFKRRQRVRRSETARFANDPENRAKLLFFTGIPNPSLRETAKKIQDAIDLEQIQYGDIVQADFIETYNNISKKAAQLFDWSCKHCHAAKYLIRTDDDVKVNITKTIENMNRYSRNYNHFILGKVRKNGDGPERNITSKYAKYFMSYEDYPYRFFPPFLLGGALGYPMKTASVLLEAMKRVPLTWLDDVFVTGICASKMGVPIFNDEAFIFDHIKDPTE